MKLIYWSYGQNFGDMLNPYIWVDRLLPRYFNPDYLPETCFLGIGTLLNEKRIVSLKKYKQKIVFSTGVGYGDICSLDETWKVYCVRGPRSAAALNLNYNLGITDGAALLIPILKSDPNPKFYQKKYKYAYMPHHELAGLGWQRACQQIGYQYIDPHSPVEMVLQQIQETEVLLAEAMHGAIVADALRVPWIPIVTNTSILSFKWLDWCDSLNLEYKPFHIEKLHNPRIARDILTPARKVRDFWRIRQASQRLKQVVKVAKPMLSSEQLLDEKIEQLQLHLEELKSNLPRPM